MNEIVRSCSTELTVKKSRFISELFYVSNQNDARSVLKDQKAKYSDARHVVHAFVIGSDAQILGCSDDGEPGGTAGRPVLDVLKGSGISNCILTVTRYFGGILLGTGGLVKAYSEAAKTVCQKAFEDGLVRPIVQKTEFCVSVSYELYETIKKIALRYEASDITENFDSEVALHGCVPKENYERFCTEVKNASGGRIRVVEQDRYDGEDKKSNRQTNPVTQN